MIGEPGTCYVDIIDIRTFAILSGISSRKLFANEYLLSVEKYPIKFYCDEQGENKWGRCSRDYRKPCMYFERRNSAFSKSSEQDRDSLLDVEGSSKILQQDCAPWIDEATRLPQGHCGVSSAGVESATHRCSPSGHPTRTLSDVTLLRISHKSVTSRPDSDSDYSPLLD
ncbi:hypothetical protein RF11_11165 [Thelohanellus kitauei]|uniref:Uncharacterized protein n=1 Tax=Thelohanellus kitauei TaxID=669202 RepID=A0A0C2JIB2_THEKT|nr:hypothetical protein RF11_11165 [Thelohanellus kitauei]